MKYRIVNRGDWHDVQCSVLGILWVDRFPYKAFNSVEQAKKAIDTIKESPIYYP